jgi:hypothetical protein
MRADRFGLCGDEAEKAFRMVLRPIYMKRMKFSPDCDMRLQAGVAVRIWRREREIC